ncbi:MAG: hypothetical protein ACRC0X_02020 [Brevinema sp.]
MKIKNEYRTPSKEGVILGELKIYPYAEENIIIKKNLARLKTSLFYTVSLNKNPAVHDVQSDLGILLTEMDSTSASNSFLSLPRENINTNQTIHIPNNFTSTITVHDYHQLIDLHDEIERFHSEVQGLYC